MADERGGFVVGRDGLIRRGVGAGADGVVVGEVSGEELDMIRAGVLKGIAVEWDEEGGEERSEEVVERAARMNRQLEVLRRQMDMERARTVLEVRPSREHTGSAEAMGEWIVGGGLGDACAVVGIPEAQVTHVRLWRDGRSVELSVSELREATGEAGGPDGGDDGVRVRSERVDEVRELGWSGGWD